MNAKLCAAGSGNHHARESQFLAGLASSSEFGRITCKTHNDFGYALPAAPPSGDGGYMLTTFYSLATPLPRYWRLINRPFSLPNNPSPQLVMPL